MSQVNTRCLAEFPEWLQSLPADTKAVSTRLTDGDLPKESRLLLAGALNYLLTSLDLIPDSMEDLGFVDDAFVLRVAVDLAARRTILREDDDLGRLASGAVLVGQLLGTDHARLEAYVGSLATRTVRGRTPTQLLEDRAIREDLLRELDGWAASYEAPAFERDEKTLVRLRSFLSTKLP